MLPVFRKLRKSLLAENRFTRYLVYALGEILLVVIGILLALQINTWNEARKFRAQQAGLLHDLKADLEANREEMREGRDESIVYLAEYRALMQAIKENRPASPAVDSLCLHLENWHSPYFTRTAYESLKNKGLEVIANDSLKEQIIYMYEKTFAYMTDDYDRMEWEFAATVKTSLLNKYIEYEEVDERLSEASIRVAPVHFEAVKADREFVNMLSQLIYNRGRGVVHFSQVVEELDSLIAAIRRELELLNAG